MNKGAPLDTNKLNGLILQSMEHELLCETDTTSIINKFAMAKFWKYNLKQWVCCLWQSNSTRTETTLSVDIAMIKIFDESGSINDCLCTLLVSMYSNVFLLGKRIRIYVFGKKEMLTIMPTIFYLGPRFSEFNMPNGTHMVAHKIYDLTFVHLLKCIFTLGPRAFNMLQAHSALIRHWSQCKFQWVLLCAMRSCSDCLASDCALTCFIISRHTCGMQYRQETCNTIELI